MIREGIDERGKMNEDKMFKEKEREKYDEEI